MSESRDETYDSVDPHTGVLSADAQKRRAGIIEALHAAGHKVAGWADALAHPKFHEAVAGTLEPDPPHDPLATTRETLDATGHEVTADPEAQAQAAVHAE